MPEFPHYALRDEVLAIVRDVAETHRLKLIPERPRLAEPRLETYDRFVPEIAEKLARFGVLQLEGSFTKHPIRFKQRRGGSAAGSYYSDERVGPRLRWMLPATSTGERAELTPGSIGYLAVKEAFRQVVATMKKHMVAVQLRKGVKIWLGRETKRQLDEGKVFVDR
jgi:hypothetical protein